MTNLKEKNPDDQIEALSTDSIPNKLLEFQKRVSAISKDSVNPFFHSKYFDVNTVIDTIKPILNEVGLTITQPLMVIDGKNAIETIVHDGVKQVVHSEVLLPEITDVQKFGAAITYFRRYALVSLLLLQGEKDDDGNEVSKPKKTTKYDKVVETPTRNGKDYIPSQTQNPAPSKTISGGSEQYPISQAQLGFLKGLYKSKLNQEITSEELKEMFNRKTASEKINELKSMVVSDPEVPTIQIEEPYIPNHEGD